MDLELVEGTSAKEAADFLKNAVVNRDELTSATFFNRILQSIWFRRALAIVGSRGSGKTILFQHIGREEFDVEDPNPATIAPAISYRQDIDSQVFEAVNDFGGDESLNNLWTKFIHDNLPYAIIVVVDLVGLIDESGKFNASSNKTVDVRGRKILVNERLDELVSIFDVLVDAIVIAYPRYLSIPQRRRLNGVLVLINKWDVWKTDDYERDGENVAAFISTVKDRVPRFGDVAASYGIDVIWRPVSLHGDYRQTANLALQHLAIRLSLKERT